MSSLEVPPLRARLLPVVLFGWCVAAIRLALDFQWPDGKVTMYFGVFYTVPLVLVWIGVTRRWGLIGWKAMAWTMLCVGALVWGLPNAISYTIGQFNGWQHGRFDPGRAAPVQEGALMKVGAGVLHGLISTLFSSAICIVVGSLFVWVPQRTVRS